MSEKIKIIIDGKECQTEKGTNLVDAAKENSIYIPTLCHFEGVKAAGSCRICSVKVNGRMMTACTTPANDGMKIENNTSEINELRKSIIELLFVQGNHFCPACEKSGNCELQALAYRYQMMVPRFPYSFPRKSLDAKSPKIMIDRNRCVLCKRCIRTIVDEQGRHYFSFVNRGYRLENQISEELANEMTDELAIKAMEMCPVGALLRKEVGFVTPIGKRKYDNKPIGSDIEGK